MYIHTYVYTHYNVVYHKVSTGRHVAGPSVSALSPNSSARLGSARPGRARSGA